MTNYGEEPRLEEHLGLSGKQGTLIKLQLVLEPSEEGGYTVFMPALPGCLSEGDTREEALANIEEAIALYLEPTSSLS